MIVRGRRDFRRFYRIFISAPSAGARPFSFGFRPKQCRLGLAKNTLFFVSMFTTESLVACPRALDRWSARSLVLSKPYVILVVNAWPLLRVNFTFISSLPFGKMLKARATSALRQNFEQKLILYIILAAKCQYYLSNSCTLPLIKYLTFPCKNHRKRLY